MKRKLFAVVLVISLIGNLVLGYSLWYNINLLDNRQNFINAAMVGAFRDFCAEMDRTHTEDELDVYYAEQQMRMLQCYNVYHATESENSSLQDVFGYLREYSADHRLDEMSEELKDLLRELSVFPDNEELAAQALDLLRALDK